MSSSQLPICRTCGVQYAAPRADCPICLDERQYVGWEGQQWTTLAELRAGGHRGRVEEEGPGVLGVGAMPSVGIGQRALLGGAARSGDRVLDGRHFIPERPRTIRRALALIEPFTFERIYGAFWGRVVTEDGAAAVRRSADRYLRFALDDDS
jgi:hypothetical protein